MNKPLAFLKEVQMEAKKVNWPTKDETIKNTITVVVFSAGVALILGIFDFLFTMFLKKFIS